MGFEKLKQEIKPFKWAFIDLLIPAYLWVCGWVDIHCAPPSSPDVFSQACHWPYSSPKLAIHRILLCPLSQCQDYPVFTWMQEMWTPVLWFVRQARDWLTTPKSGSGKSDLDQTKARLGCFLPSHRAQISCKFDTFCRMSVIASPVCLTITHSI